MWRKSFPILLVGILTLPLCDAVADESQSPLERSKPLAQEFMKTLMKELGVAISQGGPAGAIEVCKEVSAQVENDFREKHEDILRVRRITLKTRNPELHTPTEEQRKWLEGMEQNWKEKPSPEPDVIESATMTTVLFPIAIQKSLCLMCHGDPETFSSELKESLAVHYPKDKATGYEMGDFRGALTIEWKKANE